LLVRNSCEVKTCLPYLVLQRFFHCRKKKIGSYNGVFYCEKKLCSSDQNFEMDKARDAQGSQARDAQGSITGEQGVLQLHLQRFISELQIPSHVALGMAS